MREVTLRWEKATLAHTAMAALDDIVERITIMGNLMISTDGVRQLLMPTFRAGKGPEDLDQIDFFKIEQVLGEREGGAIVVYNTHPLVQLAANTENIHILVPCNYENGNFTFTVRGLPKSVAGFVRMSEAIIPPASVRVQTLTETKDELTSYLTPRQLECFGLASKHGFYNEPKRITIQGLAEVMGIARSTFQEHLNSAEQAVLQWASSQLT